MAIHLSAPRTTELKPRIVVFGVGGAGGNAVNNMIEAGLEGVEFVVANTDAQQLQFSKTDRRVQLGVGVTQGLGAGAHPEVGMTAAEESIHEIVEHLEGAHMVFITAGMGGGTGTGAAPIIARAARERGILTVGVVTKPFSFEGRHRMRLADAGIIELQRFVDTLIIIPNQNLFRIANERTTFAEAFGMADQVLHSGVRSITDLMVLPGLINLDFADVRSVMSDMGKAMMGTGEASGEDRAMLAAQNAIQNPLLDETSLRGAKAVLVNVTGGLDMTLLEVDEAANAISSEVDQDANIIFGAAFDPSLEGRLRVSVVATGMDGSAQAQAPVHTTASTPAPAIAPHSPFIPPRERPVVAATPAPVVETPRAPAPQPVSSELFTAPRQETPVAPVVAEAPKVSVPEVPEIEVPVVAREERVIGRIVDPMAEDDVPVAPEAEAPRAPVISRPASYGERVEARPVAPAPAPAPTYNQPSYAPEEEPRNSIWSVFRTRQRQERPITAPAAQASPSSRGYGAPEQRMETPAMPEPAPQAAEVEDDLEIPAFLRRLAN
jgi:cell division protein FtsZ